VPRGGMKKETSGESAPVATCRMLKEPTLGKLWSLFSLVPLCPSRSLTSVAAMECLVASWLEKAKLDPVGETVK
jgi:hypothetical protein